MVCNGRYLSKYNPTTTITVRRRPSRQRHAYIALLDNALHSTGSFPVRLFPDSVLQQQYEFCEWHGMSVVLSA
jgi:hypothetical protein